jgi:hypothetical protein
MSWLKGPERNHVGLNMGMIFDLWACSKEIEGLIKV